MIRIVLFDIDGTLIRTGGAGVKAFAHTCETEFHVKNGAADMKFAGRTDTSLVREFFVNHGIDPSPANFARFFEAYLSELKHRIVNCDGDVCPGIHQTLETLRGATRPPAIGLLTGNVKRGAEIKLRRYDLWDQFSFGAFADDHEDRDCIADTAKRRGEEHLRCAVRGEEVLVIGDTPHDIRCARSIGAKVLAVTTGGFKADVLRDYQPDWLAEDLSEMDLARLCA